MSLLAGVSIWRLIIAASALYGFGDATGWSRDMEGLSQQASLLTAIVYIGLLIYPAFTGGTRHEPNSPWLRGATAVLLLLVAGTFFGIMGGDVDYLPFEHIYTPLLVLVDWLAVGRNQAAARWWHPLTWTAFPLAYLVYFLGAGVYRELYDFLDPRDEMFAGMVGGLLVAVIVIGYLLYGLGKLKGAVGGRPTGPPLSAPVQPHSAQQVPSQSHPVQPYPAQPYPAQPNPHTGPPPYPRRPAVPQRSAPQPYPPHAGEWPYRQPGPPGHTAAGHHGAGPG